MGDDCAMYQMLDVCEWGHLASSEGISANDACCACGGGLHETIDEIFKRPNPSSCGPGIRCDYHGGGRCICPFGTAGVNCSNSTSTVRIKQFTFIVMEGSEDTITTLKIPLSRTAFDAETITTFEIYDAHISGVAVATSAGSQSCTAVIEYLPAELVTCAASLEAAATASASVADYELLPPFDDVTWTNATSGFISGNFFFFSRADSTFNSRADSTFKSTPPSAARHHV